MAGVDRQNTGSASLHLPRLDIFYADDNILLSTEQHEMQTRFGLLEELVGKVGLYMNRDNTVLMLAKVKGKQTLGTSVCKTSRETLPFSIYYSDGVQVQIV